MTKYYIRPLIVIVSLILPAAGAWAEVRLPAVISDRMVLQQGIENPVWGWADAGEQVTVSIADQKLTATPDDAGKWMVKLKPLQATGEPATLTIEGKNKLVVNDVLVGEVWVCSGQSNMEWSVNSGSASEEEKASADYPQMRMFTVQKAVVGKPAQELKGEWVICTPQTVGGFSAVAYFFGKELHKQLGQPVGLIHTSWGGTPAESWTERSALEADADLKPIVERWEQQLADFEKQVEALPQQLAEWKTAAAAAEAAGRPIPNPPSFPQDPRSHAWRPAGLYNAMIAPLVPYGIKGAIWYQGESNAGRAYQYRKLLPAMVATWRKAWGQGDFPFGIVQLANFTPRNTEPVESDWAELREAQAMTAAQPNNGLAVTIDIGDAADIHPRNKEDVGKRLAAWALSTTYGKEIAGSGPVFESMQVEGNVIRLKFAHTHGGLEARGGPLKGFAVAGEDRKWVWADAKIEGEEVVVTSAHASQPVAVRYAWSNNPECNLYNNAGLPAVPFRTDDWPGVTVNNR